MPPHPRLTRAQIAILRALAIGGAGGLRPIGLGPKARRHVVPLWRRGIVEVWFQVLPADQAGPRTARYSLSRSGRQLALRFIKHRPPSDPGDDHVRHDG